MSAQILTGSFVNVASTAKFVPIAAQINSFRLWNLTRSGVTSQGVAGSLTSDRITYAEFNPNLMSAGTALIKQNGTAPSVLAPWNNGVLPQNGFTLFDAANQVKGPNIAVSSFGPNAADTVFTCGAAHGFVVGDNVRIGSMTSAPELGGLVMTVTAVGGGGTTFTTLLDSANSLTSVGVVYKVGNAGLPPPSLYYPEYRAIARISLANPMVVVTLVQQNYQVGDVVTFQIPTAYGMQDLDAGTDGLPYQATVTAVNNAVGTQSLTFGDVDSSGFTAFAWPLAASYPASLPVMLPYGEGNLNQLSGVVPAPLAYGNQNILGLVRQNLGSRGILIGTGDGTNAVSTGGLIGSTTDAWMWEATTSSQTYY